MFKLGLLVPSLIVRRIRAPLLFSAINASVCDEVAAVAYEEETYAGSCEEKVKGRSFVL